MVLWHLYFVRHVSHVAKIQQVKFPKVISESYYYRTFYNFDTHSCLFKSVSGIQYLIFFLYVFLEPAQNSMKYITWHRTASSRSSSSKNPLDANSRENLEDHTNNLFDSSCMISGSHASTLDRLHAWERKLYDEVKVPCISHQHTHRLLCILGVYVGSIILDFE